MKQATTEVNVEHIIYSLNVFIFMVYFILLFFWCDKIIN